MMMMIIAASNFKYLHRLIISVVRMHTTQTHTVDSFAVCLSVGLSGLCKPDGLHISLEISLVRLPPVP